MGDIMWYLHMCLQYILDLPPPSFSLFLPSPSLRTISTDFILLVSYMNTKYIYHVHPHSSFPCAYPSPTGIHPQKRPILKIFFVL
jgi:hypothetical protein